MEKTLQLSMDYNIQMYAQQMAEKVMEEKQADGVDHPDVNPSNGELYAMVNVPEFDLDEPFTLPQGTVGLTEEENRMRSIRCGGIAVSMTHMNPDLYSR